MKIEELLSKDAAMFNGVCNGLTGAFQAMSTHERLSILLKCEEFTILEKVSEALADLVRNQ